MDRTPLIERDISWLSFNERVLQEAKDPTVPLYERLKFLAIFSSNLDEFFRVRVSSMRSFKKMRKSVRKQLDIKPKRILKTIHSIVFDQQEEFGRIFGSEILPELARHGIHLVRHEDFTKEHQKKAGHIYSKKLAKFVTPHELHLDEEVIFLENQGLYLVVQHNAEATDLTLLPIPSDEIDRFVLLSSGEGQHDIAFIDDLMRNAIDSILPGRRVLGVYAIKMSRDAELYLGDEFSGDLMQRLEQSLETRATGLPTRFLYDRTMPDVLKSRLKAVFQLTKDDFIPGARYHNFNDFFGFPDPSRNPALHDRSMPPLAHPEFETSQSLMEVIEANDIMLHFPYQRYDYVPKLIREAADHPAVKSISITLYRVARDSDVAHALLYAVQQGKQVTAFIEAKARFDEESNLYWGRQLEKKGAHVLYSYPGIKVHSKLLQIASKREGKTFYTTYLGTGNFNEKTAKLYGDHALFTADQSIGKEVFMVFEVLRGKLIAPKTKHLFVSPFTTRRNFTKRVEREISNAQQGKEAWMILKMNALEDSEMIDKLYQASQAGVKIQLIVRGFCCLIAGRPGLSENIEVISIVDRYLEHARIYVFSNDGKPEMFLASADWMTRNLDRRVEVVFPIYRQSIFDQLMAIVNLQLADNVKARVIDADQINAYVPRAEGQPVIRSQDAIYEMLRGV